MVVDLTQIEVMRQLYPVSCPDTAVKYFNQVTGLFLVQCSREEFRKLWCAITFISDIRNLPVLFNLLDLSGNIRTSRKTIAKFEQEKLRLLKLQPEPLTRKKLDLFNTAFQKAQAWDT
ncbi:hypothetical protein AXG93_313s1080 [Marchantia polymorpha subsp. ruderalis]|uniref:Uncharacterized protein n=1 Tax=Marchantia polymorpha subsp. ruderalis TaxID=1480154 RepID=A0A176VES2_MARPO|nr:hypothetical protein AXG93_313s1080 [Marchantia polymorpha subsp. ruderalis]